MITTNTVRLDGVEKALYLRAKVKIETSAALCGLMTGKHFVNDVKELKAKNTQLIDELTQLKPQVRSQAPAPANTDNAVSEWKRRACEEVLGSAPVGKPP